MECQTEAQKLRSWACSKMKEALQAGKVAKATTLGKVKTGLCLAQLQSLTANTAHRLTRKVCVIRALTGLMITCILVEGSQWSTETSSTNICSTSLICSRCRGNQSVYPSRLSLSRHCSPSSRCRTKTLKTKKIQTFIRYHTLLIYQTKTVRKCILNLDGTARLSSQ